MGQPISRQQAFDPLSTLLESLELEKLKPLETELKNGPVYGFTLRCPLELGKSGEQDCLFRFPNPNIPEIPAQVIVGPDGRLTWVSFQPPGLKEAQALNKWNRGGRLEFRFGGAGFLFAEQASGKGKEEAVLKIRPWPGLVWSGVFRKTEKAKLVLPDGREVLISSKIVNGKIESIACIDRDRGVQQGEWKGLQKDPRRQLWTLADHRLPGHEIRLSRRIIYGRLEGLVVGRYFCAGGFGLLAGLCAGLWGLYQGTNGGFEGIHSKEALSFGFSAVSSFLPLGALGTCMAEKLFFVLSENFFF